MFAQLAILMQTVLKLEKTRTISALRVCKIYQTFMRRIILNTGPRNSFDVSVGEIGPFNPAGFDNCEKLFKHIR